MQQFNHTMQSSIHSEQCNALKNKISNRFENEKSLKTAAAAAAATQRLSASEMEHFLHYHSAQPTWECNLQSLDAMGIFFGYTFRIM
jgi:hypothetical protein